MNQDFLLLSENAISSQNEPVSVSVAFPEPHLLPEFHQGRLSGDWTQSNGERTSQGMLFHLLRAPFTALLQSLI